MNKGMERDQNPARDEQGIRQLAEMMGISPEELLRRKQEVARAVHSMRAEDDRKGGGRASGRRGWRPGEHFRWQQSRRSDAR
jgi:hypothetical protein